MNYSHVIGSRFGELTVVRPVDHKDKMLCRCQCGNDKVARLSHLRSGSVKSCGCLLIRRPKEVHGKHFASKTPEHKAWCGMIARCTKSSHHAFDLYGGRGITVCDRWLGSNGFNLFLSDMGSRPVGKSLDRIDNNAAYSPENCRWADVVIQSNNRRTNILFESAGQSKTLADWSRVTGVSDNTMRERLKRGWSIDDAIHKPARPLKITQN